MNTEMDGAWREILNHAVSPFSDGVRNLRIQAWHAPETEAVRPERTAAVLVPILDRALPCIVLTRRAGHLAKHPGQISFPGGSVDDQDSTAVETALREAHEEIGLDPQAVTPLGFLDRVDTVSGYRVLPVVGLVSAQARWVPDRNEVDEVFELPLDRALDRSTYERREIERDGALHVIYSMNWQGKVIWGVTAAILLNLARRAERAGGLVT